MDITSQLYAHTFKLLQMHSHFLNYFSICLNCNSYLVWISFLWLLASDPLMYACVRINIQQRKSTKNLLLLLLLYEMRMFCNIFYDFHLLYCSNLFTAHVFFPLSLLVVTYYCCNCCALQLHSNSIAISAITTHMRVFVWCFLSILLFNTHLFNLIYCTQYNIAAR